DRMRGQLVTGVQTCALPILQALRVFLELQIPAKLYESVAMGIPTLVVAPAGSAAAVEGERVGAVVRDAADIEGIACVLERLWRDGSQVRLCPVPITYEAIAPVVDKVLQQRRRPDPQRPRPRR